MSDLRSKSGNILITFKGNKNSKQIQCNYYGCVISDINKKGEQSNVVESSNYFSRLLETYKKTTSLSGLRSIFNEEE